MQLLGGLWTFFHNENHIIWQILSQNESFFQSHLSQDAGRHFGLIQLTHVFASSQADEHHLQAKLVIIAAIKREHRPMS